MLSAIKNFTIGFITGIVSLMMVFIPLMAAFCPSYVDMIEMYQKYINIWVG